MSDFVSRRKFIKSAGIVPVIGYASTLFPARFCFAATPGNKKLLVVIMRGAMDGLGAIIPYDDKNYVQARGAMAIQQNQDTMINLDGFFAMHSSMKLLQDMFNKKEIMFLHAAATPYRDRSHFDAQNLLEIGADTPHILQSGWLNRMLATLTPQPSTLAVGDTIPLLLQGDAKVNSWSPAVFPDPDQDYLNRVEFMYQTDKKLLEAIQNSQQLKGGDIRGAKQFVGMMQNAAKFMADPTGPTIATIEIGGWDTHVNQGLDKGRLPANLEQLSEGLSEFKKGMADSWKNTVVITMTEFGRTVKGNGTGGTDHGTGTVSFLMGGSVNGGRVVGDWPGLAKLYQDRDLIPANDLRGFIKTLLVQHLKVSKNKLDTNIFPKSDGVWFNDNLFI